MLKRRSPLNAPIELELDRTRWVKALVGLIGQTSMTDPSCHCEIHKMETERRNTSRCSTKEADGSYVLS